MKKVLVVLLTFVFFFSAHNAVLAVEASDALSADKYIEAVDFYLPDICIYVSGSTYSQDMEAKASLDGEALTFNGASQYDPSSDSTRIYILADISGSISSVMFEAVKNTLKTYISTLTACQTIKLYTFSQDVNEVLNGNETYDEACEKIDAVMVTGNGYTALYDALYLIHEEAAAEKELFDRQLLFVFTDGVDEDNKAKRTFDEAKSILKSHDLPVYSLCMDYASSQAKENLGELSRISGGVNAVFGLNTVESTFQTLMDTAFSCVRLNFSKNNNKADDKDKNLSVSVNGLAYPSITVYESAVRIQEDLIPPTYKIEYSADENCLLVQFSEPVLNADKVASYLITSSDNKAIPVEAVKYDSSSATAYLYFSEKLYSDTYTVALSGVTDDSYAANPPAAAVTAYVKAVNPALKILEHLWILLVPLCIIIIVLLVLLVVKKKRKITNVKELFEVENEHNYEVKHHIVNAAKGREIVLKILTDHTANEIKTRISTSLIFGRSDTCDICIDDVKLSRQHFAFERAENGEIYTFDLNSTNGTFLNGSKLTGKSSLKSGDMIAAGLTKITVNFV